MNEPKDKPGIANLSIKWIARVLSILCIGFILLMFIGSGLQEGFNPSQFTFRDVIGLFFFPFGICVGMVIAWRWEGLGGIITIGSLLFFYASLRIMNGRFPRGPYFIILSSPGILFLLSWIITVVRKKSSLSPFII